MTRTRGRRMLLAAMGAMVVFLAAFSLRIGYFHVTSGVILDALKHGIVGRELTDRGEILVWYGRLPTAIIALLAGASLGAAGLLMQTFFRNPLAGPDVMGVSAGASLGVASLTLAKDASPHLASLLGGQVGLLGAASFGALVVLALALVAARWYDDAWTLLILGLMFAAFTSSVVGIIAQFAKPESLQRYVLWTAGSFDGSNVELATFAGAVVIGLVAAMAVVKSLNVLQLGPEYAQALGLRLRRTRVAILAIAAVLAGATTAVCGPIAFLGIAAPHLARIAFRTSDHRWLLPASILIGASLAIAVDIAAKTLARPAVLPINTVSGVLGAPFVIWVVLRWRPRA